MATSQMCCRSEAAFRSSMGLETLGRATRNACRLWLSRPLTIDSSSRRKAYLPNSNMDSRKTLGSLRPSAAGDKSTFSGFPRQADPAVLRAAWVQAGSTQHVA